METKDALLHAINEEFVEAVEVLLDHEETIHKPGELHVSLINYRLIIFRKFTISSRKLTNFSTQQYSLISIGQNCNFDMLAMI